ncbi:MAG: hypothetical protein MK294_02135, partial [Rhodospirillales bacterium]|nr:hypothetical protein [Rhodospirillales bacterium]
NRRQLGVLFSLFQAALTAPADHAQETPQLCDNRRDVFSALDGNSSESPFPSVFHLMAASSRC